MSPPAPPPPSVHRPPPAAEHRPLRTPSSAAPRLHDAGLRRARRAAPGPGRPGSAAPGSAAPAAAPASRRRQRRERSGAAARLAASQRRRCRAAVPTATATATAAWPAAEDAGRRTARPTAPRGRRTPAGPGEPSPGQSRLPTSFGSPASMPPPVIGSQNVHGSDGPSAGDSAANGAPAADDAGGSAQVTVPPSAAPDQRCLSSIRSSRTGSAAAASPQHGTAFPAVRAEQVAQGEQVAQAEQAAGQTAASRPGSRPPTKAGAPPRHSQCPAAGDTTQAGLPRRVRELTSYPVRSAAEAANAESRGARQFAGCGQVAHVQLPARRARRPRRRTADRGAVRPMNPDG